MKPISSSLYLSDIVALSAIIESSPRIAIPSLLLQLAGELLANQTPNRSRKIPKKSPRPFQHRPSKPILFKLFFAIQILH